MRAVTDALSPANIRKFSNALLKAVKGLTRSIPVILTVILLISLLKTYVPAESIIGVFGFSTVTDTLIGAVFGSVFAGHSINSYIIGSQLLTNGAPLSAVTAFLATWVIVGVVQLPAEAQELGGGFALKRTLLGFVFSVVIALIVSIVFGGSLP
jgi:uncharacterized membrane protein YraQ (UPF0718 family)